MNGRVEALWIKRARKGPMDPVPELRLIEGTGIEGNADQGGWRQVTVIEREIFERVRQELSPAVDPAMRRANVLLSGVDLTDARGRTLVLGDCRILMRGETRPCEQMDEAHPGLREALSPPWAAGAFGRVVAGGVVRVGDPSRLEDAPADAGVDGTDGSATARSETAHEVVDAADGDAAARSEAAGLRPDGGDVEIGSGRSSTG